MPAKPKDPQAKGQDSPAPRRGRPKSGEREARRERVLDAAFEELMASGYDGVTMLAIAKRAGASKETLYSWFGNREGLFAALIERNGDQAAAGVKRALSAGGEPRPTLIGFATALLTLLTAHSGVALNRAAMATPELAELLLAGGRHRVGPIVEEYLAELGEAGDLVIEDPAEAFTLLYGLVIRDSQIRVLLGESPPTPAEIEAQATRGVDCFFELVAG